ncbi:MAG: hypothetical protein IPO58_24735 [Betaproteobacteria bacterium]|nr:hypothetical protein [Betaproteobacteria bacterium]
MSTLGSLARIALVAAALGPTPPSQASAAVDCPDPAPIVAGIQQLVSGGAPGPLFATAPGVVAIVSGDEDTPVPSTFPPTAAERAARCSRSSRRAGACSCRASAGAGPPTTRAWFSTSTR